MWALSSFLPACAEHGRQVRAAPGELDLSLVTEGFQVVVDEFRSHVGIDSQQFKRHGLFDLCRDGQALFSPREP